MTKEELRLKESDERKKHWKRWGPYLSESSWGAVHEDYSATGESAGGLSVVDTGIFANNEYFDVSVE